MGLAGKDVWMASQTSENLQAVAMTAVVMTLTKPSHMDIWSKGRGRCSEISRSASPLHVRWNAKMLANLPQDGLLASQSEAFL